VPDSGGPAPVAGSPANGRPRFRRSGRAWRDTALVALLLLALAVVLTWPVTTHLGSAASDLGDPVLTTWILAWNIHALTAAPLRLFDANMFHPRRWALAYTEHLLGLVPFVGAARLIGADPLVAHNLVWLATFPMVGLALFWLVRHLTGHTGAAALAAVLYAFSHFRFGQMGHVQILSHQWLPIMLLGLHRAAEHGGRWRDLGLAAGALALQALSSGYHAVFATIAGALFVGWLALPGGRPPLGRLTVRGGVLAGLVALLLLPFILPYRIVRGETGLTRSYEEIVSYAARPRAYLAAPETSRWLGEATARFRVEEAALAPGLVPLALAAGGAVLAWRGRAASGRARAPRPRWRRALDVAIAALVLVALANWLLFGRLTLHVGAVRLSSRAFGWTLLLVAAAVLVARRCLPGAGVPVPGLGWLRGFGWPNSAGYYVALTVVGVVGSFGPSLELGGQLTVRPLYYQLYGVMPGFDALRVPARFGVLVTTGLAVLAGLAAAALARRLARHRRRALVLGGLGVMAVLEVWVAPLRLAAVSPEPGPAARWLAAQRGMEAVLVLPMRDRHAGYLESLRLLESTAHWRPLVNGYSGVYPRDYAADVALLNTFPAPAAVGRLRAMYVRYVVVNLGQYPPRSRARLAAALEQLPPGVTRAAIFPHTQILEIGPEPARMSGQAGGEDELPGAGQDRRLHQPRGAERVEALGDREHRVKAIAPRQEPLSRPLLAVDQDHQVLDHEARGLERLDRLQLGRSVGDDVVDHDHALPRLEPAFDAPPRAVRLRLAARIDEGDAPGEAGGHRQGETRVRDARDPVGPAACHLGRHEPPDLREHVRVRDHHPQVDVEGRRGPGLQHELSEAHASDRVEPPHEEPGVRRAHAGISARMAAAAAAGSGAPVIGRPTTR